MMGGILNWRKCKECGEDYDIGVDKDICPECRRKNGGLGE